MYLHELIVRARAGQIQGVNLVCLEGGAYLIEAKIGPQLMALQDAQSQPLKVLSIEQARDLVKDVPMTLELEQADASEEMCGLPEARLRVG